MRIASTYALKRRKPAWPAKARYSEIFAWRGSDAPAGYRRGAFQDLLLLRRTTKNEGRHSRSFGGQLQPLRCRRGVFRDLPDDTCEARVSQAFFHRKQYVGVTSSFDMDYPIRVQAGEVKGRCEQVPPAQAPEDGSFGTGKNSGKEDGRAGIVGQVRAAGDLMESTCSNATARQARIDRIYPKRDSLVADASAFDSSNTGS